MSAHVVVEPGLALDPSVRYVEDILRVSDPQLRLRRSIDTPGHFVLERRVRRSKVMATSRRLSDRGIQARDGYIHITTVHPWWLQHPDRIVARLHEDGEDLHRVGFDTVDRQLRQADADARAQRRARRYDHFAHIAAEGYDLRQRVGHEGVGKYRINNVGTRPLHHTRPSSTGEIPVSGERTDEYATRTPSGQSDRSVHDSASA